MVVQKPISVLTFEDPFSPFHSGGGFSKNHELLAMEGGGGGGVQLRRPPFNKSEQFVEFGGGSGCEKVVT